MKIAIIGYGKMGKEIEKMISRFGFSVSVIMDNERDWNEKLNDFLQSDVAIEFSTPETAIGNLKKCFTYNIPLVSGTTGWNDRLQEVLDMCRETSNAFIYGSNFSIGANLFFRINEIVAKMMNQQEQYDVEIEEIHHTMKKDAPSGTAITTAQIVLSQLDRKKDWILNENGDVSNINIVAKRVEDVPGTHIVNYFSTEDSIEIKHTANDRSGFALGAVKAAAWLTQNKGIYDFKDIFTLINQNGE